MTRLVSAIYSRGPQPPDPEGTPSRLWRLCRNMWVTQGTIVVKPGELPDGLRGPMEAWANDQFGERQHGKQR